MDDLKIVAVAIKIPMGKIYSEDLPYPHHYVLNDIRDDVDYMRYGGGLTPDYEEKFVYGYLLSDGSFVDRREAMNIALMAGQLVDDNSTMRGLLYSYQLKKDFSKC